MYKLINFAHHRVEMQNESQLLDKYGQFQPIWDLLAIVVGIWFGCVGYRMFAHFKALHFHYIGSPNVSCLAYHHRTFYIKESLFRCLWLVPTLTRLSKAKVKLDSVCACIFGALLMNLTLC